MHQFDRRDGINDVAVEFSLTAMHFEAAFARLLLNNNLAMN
jgi:hypothetical protein